MDKYKGDRKEKILNFNGKIGLMTVFDIKENSFLFSWNDIHGNDKKRLIDHLEKSLKINWVKNAEIKKSNDEKTITVKNGTDSLTLECNEEKENVTIKVNGVKSHGCILKKDNGKLKIYEDLIHELRICDKKHKKKAEKIKEQIKQVRNFHKGPGIPKISTERNCLKGFKIHIPLTGSNTFKKDVILKADVIYSEVEFLGSKDLRVGTLFFNFELCNCNVDNLIRLRHFFIEKNKMNVKLPRKSNFEEMDVTMVRNHYIQNLTEDPNKNHTYTCIEICKDQNHENRLNDKSSDFVEKYKRQIYSILVGDESWQFVTEETAKNRISKDWSTRNFVSAIPFSNSLILINLKGTRYKNCQEGFCKDCNPNCIQYFKGKYEITCLDHGVFHIIEMVIGQYWVLKRAEGDMPKKEPDIVSYIKKLVYVNPPDIVDLKSKKHKIEKITSMSLMETPEVNELEKMIKSEIGIESKLKNFEKERQKIEDTLNTRYSEDVNFRALILSGVVFIYIATQHEFTMGLIHQIVKKEYLVGTITIYVADVVSIILFLVFSLLFLIVSYHLEKTSEKEVNPLEYPLNCLKGVVKEWWVKIRKKEI